MESMPGQLRDAGRDASSSPNSKQDAQSFSSPSSLKPNQVSETSLYGVPIVCLVIDGKERLCLAQISNTLLKNYSYNEIHNRRVALGITCVQCTPVQLELLRRAGAMPISSRRCGMITKREAERLCKSFLGAHSPPKLPENFAFDVSHECAWGCRGSFIPARYNSSRAKCIKCSFCNMYFSPNKFIFHSHRTTESKYLQPDAANFNSWRRHLKLTDKKSEDINHAWEDVKAMFNGGSRKRTLPMSGSGMSSSMKSQASSSLAQTSSPEIPHKTLRCDEEQGNNNLGLAGGPRTYPVIPVPSKSFGMLQKIPPPLFPHHPYGFPSYGLCQKKSDGVPDANKTNVSGVFWPGAKDTLYPAFPMFWPTAGGLPMPPYPGSPPKHPPELPGVRAQGELDLSDQSDRCANTPKDTNHHPHHPQDSGERCSSSQSSSTRNDEDKSGDETSQRKISYISAFRPVVKDAETIAKLYGNRESYGVRSGYLSPDFISESSSYRSISPDRDSVVDDDDDDDPDVDVESNRGQDENDLIQISPGGDRHDSPIPDRVSVSGAEESQEHPDASSPGAAAASASASSPEDSAHTGSSDEDRRMRNGSPLHEVYAHEKDGHVLLNEPSPFGSKQSSRSNGVHQVSEIQNQRNTTSHQEQKDRQADGALRIDISVHERDLENMAKEELQKQLVEQVELRKKLEREFQHLKDNFQDQMKRELSYREEMVQQLQIVRDTLCSELDQERKARYAIQQKLKAHDALHHFSCKMLTHRQCTGACTFKPPLLPP
ncbi:SKI family transcriptional corepressor 1 homolog-B isoform X2 [Larimichthys crocea]|uniref:SKI family transcriptional corepressor 1 homolog-B isoform X2 n=1 Tax=Larimichthys crocea TaxID=215358 RepID=UPI0009019ACB|nr:SKI family transcriptional corepressor 1 homolog-B isoform X2 [Larimichthys crocea]